MHHHPETAWNLAVLFFPLLLCLLPCSQKILVSLEQVSHLCSCSGIKKWQKKHFYNFLFFSMRSMPQCPKWNSLLVLQGFLTNHETVPGQPSE